MKQNIKLIVAIGLMALGALALFTGCAHFTTKQTDERNGETTTITTKVTGWTFFDSKSQLANFKASQTEKTQGASVGSLTQESSGSNAVATVKVVIEGLK